MHKNQCLKKINWERNRMCSGCVCVCVWGGGGGEGRNPLICTELGAKPNVFRVCVCVCVWGGGGGGGGGERGEIH